MYNKARIILTVITAILMLFKVDFLTAQEISIKIIETSDVHGAIFPYNFLEDTEAKSSLAQVQTYLNEQRSNEDQTVLLFDNGDMLQGTPAVYFYNYVKTQEPHLYARVMNYMRYDLATIGNHDIETGHQVYDKFIREIDFPWLAANAVDISTGEPYFKPYQILHVEGIKIAVLGLITPAIPKWLPPQIWSGIRFEDMIETAEKWVPILMDKENPDLLVGLFHAGVDYSYAGENRSTYKNENASLLVAERVPGFDIIFVGHDHQGWNKQITGPDGNDVLILGARAGASTLAVANIGLRFDESSETWSKNIEGEIVRVDNYSADREFMEYFSPEMEEIKNYVSKPIGWLTETISSRDAIFGPSSFMDLIHQVQLDLTGADLSFSSPLSMNSEIEAGELTLGDTYKLYRYENLLYEIELSGKEIKDYLEYSYEGWFNQMTNPEDNLLKFKKDQNGNIIFSERSQTPALENRYYNFDSAGGIDYTVDVSKPSGRRVEIEQFSDGRPFVMNKRYKVAINSYRGSGGGGHLQEGVGLSPEEINARTLHSSERDLRFHITEWIENKKKVEPIKNYNWQVLPEKWYELAKEKDYLLLFGQSP